MSNQVELRKTFSQLMEKYMAENEKIIYFDADLAKGIGTLNLHEKFPNRAFNVGVAEQNMTSVAAGMASYGYLPFITTFTPFATRRICDQIAISCLYAKQNVKIVGSDPGISAEINGGTHMSMEDIGVIRSIPEMVIFEPVDHVQLTKSLPKIIEYPKTMYIRLWRGEIENVFDEDYEFDLFKADMVKEGSDVTIFATGFMVQQSLKACKELEKKGIHAEVINVHTIKPIDVETVVASVKKTGCCVMAENHNVIGGMGSAVSEVLMQNYPVPAEFVGVQDRFGQVGYLDFLEKEYNMTPADIAAAAEKVIARK